MRWFHSVSYQRSPLDALEDASSALTVGLGGRPAQLILAFVDGAFRGQTTAIGNELARRHDDAVTLVVPVPSLGLPIPGAEIPRFALRAFADPKVRLVPWRCEPHTGRLDLPMLPGPLGLLTFVDATSVDVDRLTAELASRCENLAGLAFESVPSPWVLGVGGKVVEGGAIGVYADDPSFAEAAGIPLGRGSGAAHIVTSGTGGVVESLDGRPALAVLEEWARALPPTDQESLSSGLDVALDLHVKSVHSDDQTLANCRVLALDRTRGAFVVDADTRPFQVLRFALRDDAVAVRTALDGTERAQDDILIWPVESSPMAHWPETAMASRQALAPHGVRGALVIAGSRKRPAPVHRHAVGVLRLR